MRDVSDGQIAVSGVFTDIRDGFQYFPPGGATGQRLTEILRQSIKGQSLKEAVEGMSPDMLRGLAGMSPDRMPDLSPNTGGN